MALLDQVRDGKAVVAEARRERDDEAHVGGREFVQGLLVAEVAPTLGEGPFLVPLEEPGRHRGFHELPPHARHLQHGRLPVRSGRYACSGGRFQARGSIVAARRAANTTAGSQGVPFPETTAHPVRGAHARAIPVPTLI